MLIQRCTPSWFRQARKGNNSNQPAYQRSLVIIYAQADQSYFYFRLNDTFFKKSSFRVTVKKSLFLISCEETEADVFTDTWGQ